MNDCLVVLQARMDSVRLPGKMMLPIMGFPLIEFNIRRIKPLEKHGAKFFLATGKDIDEQIILKEIMNSKFKEKCIPLDNLNIVDILPIIKNCDISICNDSRFSHLSAALEIPTIVMMADTPLVYGDYSPNMQPIIPDGYKTVSHNTLGKNKINPEKVFKKYIELLN